MHLTDQINRPTPSLKLIDQSRYITSDTVVNGETTTFSTITYFVDFDEGVTDFMASDIVLSGTADAAISEFTEFPEEDIVRYTFTVTVDRSGTVSVFIPEDMLIDASHNGNEASNTYTATVNIDPPQYMSSVTTDANTITITADKLLIGTCRY